MSIADASMTRDVLRDLGRRPVDISNLDVHVQHGVVYLRGRIDKLRGYYEDMDLEEELNIILKCLHQKTGITDVVCEVDLQGPSIRERMSPRRRRYY
ncbi:MAG: hypothetical protein A2Z18_01045 [Armatimonadetes bacterium RBG_16_58_9]|jgi:hypothetical protein|nr:MAG: hypothetical protein A2Z18_01045 [Armatimonadetes bacterium RBG_16_58_9]